MESAFSEKRSATFVLVHGSWHGGWCWRKLVPLLRAAGHEVYTPTLTGLGERSHLIHPMIDLTTHIQDIVAVLEYEDLHDVILVGHSYAGMVIAGVAARVESRLAQLVYLDAFMPEDGKALKDYTDLPLEELVREKGGGWRLTYEMLGSPPTRFGVEESEALAWLIPRLRDQPFRTHSQPAQLPAGTGASLRQSYILLTDSWYFVEAASRAKRQGFAVH